MVARLLLVTLTVLAAVIGVGSGTASAHAELESTTPSAGESLDVAPTRIELRFTEDVRVVAGGIRLIDESGTRVDRTEATAEKGTIVLPVPALHDGAYVLSWRVISADGHPIRGAFTFRVGNTGDQQAVASLAARLLSGSQGRTDVGAAYAVLRILSFAAMLVLLGAAAYLLVVRNAPTAGSERGERGDVRGERGGAAHHGDVGPQRRLLRIVQRTAVVAAIAGFGAVLVYGPYASGRSFGALTDGTLLDDTLRDRVGRSLLLRTIGLGVLAYAVHEVVLRATGPRRRLDRVLLLLTVGLVLVAQAGTGHATVGRWAAISVVSTVAHVGAAGAWLGGLVIVLLVVLRPRRREDDEQTSAAVPAVPVVLAEMRRYSTLAFWSVAVIVVTGVVESFRQVGTMDALTTTTFGRLLIVKVAIVAALLALGGMNRRWLQRGDAAAGPGLATLRRRMLVETAGAVAVVVVTSLLVNAAPARETVSRPVSQTLRAQTMLVDVTFDPARTGRNEIHFYMLTAAGLPLDVYAMSATMELPSAGVAPITLRTLRAGSNHYQVLGADLPVAGTWRVTVNVQIDEFTEESAVGVVRIR